GFAERPNIRWGSRVRFTPGRYRGRPRRGRSPEEDAPSGAAQALACQFIRQLDGRASPRKGLHRLTRLAAARWVRDGVPAGRGDARAYFVLMSTVPTMVLPSSRVTMIWCLPGLQLSVPRLKTYCRPSKRKPRSWFGEA